MRNNKGIRPPNLAERIRQTDMGGVIEVPFIVSMTIAILCLFAGLRMNRALKVLHDWGVSNAVTGGLLVAGACWLLFALTGTRIQFDLVARDILLLYFFAGLGLPILCLFAVHVGLVVAYILVLVFPLMGKNYDAAVVASGFTGIGLGSTATAFANMSAITSIHGSSPNAFIMLSLVAALFLDVANSTLVALILK